MFGALVSAGHKLAFILIFLALGWLVTIFGTYAAELNRLYAVDPIKIEPF